MRFTIERIRTLVILAGVVLVVALGAFLAVGKWKNPFNRRDIPKRLGIDIEQEANGVTYTQAHAGHTLFKIHASKVVQLKNSHAMLHDVQIELYGVDGSRVDRIVGDEFEYDQKGGIATAAGPVEITLMRPGEKPAIATLPLVEEAGGKKPLKVTRPATPLSATQASSTHSPNTSSASGAPSAMTAPKGQIDVKTSGLVFNQQTGVATTSERVDFSSLQGTGSSMGATFNSQNGLLVLDRTVELTTRPAAEKGRRAEPVEMHAAHAEIERDSSECRLHMATAKTRSEDVSAADAKLLFRDDGSIAQLEVTGGFSVVTATGGHLAAPNGTMEFDTENHPHLGHLEGGVTMDSAEGGRVTHGSSSTMDLEFTADGDLRNAHMVQGVEVHSDEKIQSTLNGKLANTEVSRTWHSSVADITFRKGNNGQLEPAILHGTGGVVMNGETRRGDAAAVPSRLAADEVSGEFGPGSALTAMTGTGHASMDETTANGTRQTATGDKLEAQFVPAAGTTNGATGAATGRPGTSAAGGGAQIQSAVIDGHVALIQMPVVQSGARAGAYPQPPLRATAGKAEYESAGEWMHLTLNPRVDDGSLQMTADKVDVEQSTGDAFAHGNVKATWTNNGSNGSGGTGGSGLTTANQGDVAFGGKGPAHAVAADAELHQSSGEATFRGHARLWQEANSVAAPMIVLDRPRQTLAARSADAAEPVRVVMVTAGSMTTPGQPPSPGNSGGKSETPSVMRVHGGDLWYSVIERRALMKGATLGTVAVETGGVQSVSNQAELFLNPASSSGSSNGAQSQVDRMMATGHVVLTSQGRHGTGEQLAYTSSTGDYVLTGTASTPPRMTDPVRGTVTGEALIFRSRDDSVSIEGGGQKTITETTAPR